MTNSLRSALFALVLLLPLTLAACDSASVRPRPEAASLVPLARLLYQDHGDAALRWADVRQSADGNLSLGPVRDVAGLKKLDPARQKLVQMRECDGLVLVGVRDEEDGAYESGWVLLHTGVEQADHGDHVHWHYRQPPQARDSRLDAAQGNPAHVYLYDGCFYLANDRLGGYTRISPSRYAPDAGPAAREAAAPFLVGGGNHITLAVVEGKVGYACWVDGGGPNKGRVDVTLITDRPRTEPAYSFRLPSGGIHGAIAVEGKVFFAPADGVCWVEADPAARLEPAAVQVHHIPLGKDGDRPRRTGAFTQHGRYVLFVTGKEETATLELLDAKPAHPIRVSLPLSGRKGMKARTPEVVTTPEGRAYAFVFHDHDKGTDVADLLDVVALDPDGDGDARDARVARTLPVGRSAVEGHFGHHDIAFDADRRFAFFTNPGDGTISALSLKSLEVVATFDVGGTPTALIAHGGRETDD